MSFRLGLRASAPYLRLLLVVGALALVTACSADSEEASASAEPPEVPVREVTTESVTVTRVYTGRTRGAREVEIRARVDGVLAAR